MYDNVRKRWTTAVARLQRELDAADPTDKPELEKRLLFFQETETAVVVSPSQIEIEEFKKKGLDIATHRKRMVKEDLETRFKKSDDPLRIVFVCATELAAVAKPDTLLAWYRKLIANKFDGSKFRKG